MSPMLARWPCSSMRFTTDLGGPCRRTIVADRSSRRRARSAIARRSPRVAWRRDVDARRRRVRRSSSCDVSSRTWSRARGDVVGSAAGDRRCRRCSSRTFTRLSAVHVATSRRALLARDRVVPSTVRPRCRRSMRRDLAVAVLGDRDRWCPPVRVHVILTVALASWLVEQRREVVAVPPPVRRAPGRRGRAARRLGLRCCSPHARDHRRREQATRDCDQPAHCA